MGIIDSVATELHLPEESMVELKDIMKKRLADLQRFLESTMKLPKEKKADDIFLYFLFGDFPN